MNKKKILIIGGLVVCFLGVGLLFRTKNKEEGTILQEKGVFTSIKDALTKNVSLTCEFKTPDGQTTKSYIKNGAVRVTSEDSTQAGEIIILKEKMYIWDTKTKQGYVYNNVTGTDVVKSESYLDMIEQYKDSCKVAVVNDSLFTPPTDINFQDMSKILEDLQKQIPASN